MIEYSSEKKSVWESFANRKESIAEFARGYAAFLSEVKTERECIAFAEARLAEQGIGISEGTFVKTLHKKCLFAARRGKKPLSEGLRLISAHADSPRLDFKQHPLTEAARIGQAKTHYYGGIHKYQWLARPLALHGVVVKKDGESVGIRIGEDPSDPVFTVADLLPHLAHEQETKSVKEAFEAEKLNVIMGHEPLPGLGKEDAEQAVKANVLHLLHERCGICEDDLYSAEIEAVPAGPARFVGLDRALIGAYGHDDRICVYTALRAFLDAETPEYATAVIFWDKEEIGSDGSTGASSEFFEYCVEDIAEMWGEGASARRVMLATRALSGDVHAATDPDWQDLHEPLNASLIGYGPTFCKFTGSRGKYGANDAHPEYIGWLRGVMDENGIPWQMAELGKVDHGGGGTVALFLARYGMLVIDLGPAVLGMHSPFELASTADVYATMLAYKAFFEAK